LSQAFNGAVAAIALTELASAADLPRTVQAPKAPVAVASNWSGFYVGASLGGRWIDSTWATIAMGDPLGPVDPTTTPVSWKSSTFRTGGYVGGNWQVNSLWVVGLEADAAWGNNKKSLAGIPGTFGTGGQGADLGAQNFDSSGITLGWDGSIRARVGFLVTPTWLLYGTGGFAWQQVEISATCNGSLFNSSWCIAARTESYPTTMIGWTAGGGIETQLGSHWFLRAEYRYSSYGNVSHIFFSDTPIDQVAVTQSLKTNTGLIGLAYRY
jgi:outer membrane immunogenic protein